MDLRKRLLRRLPLRLRESALRQPLRVCHGFAALTRVESAGKYFSQENPVIREITQRVQTMYE